MATYGRNRDVERATFRYCRETCPEVEAAVWEAEATYPPALFRALRPLLDQRAVMVREAAEDELKAETIEASRTYRLDNALVGGEKLA